ncbi:MAG: amidohydrolase [Candidatus Thorarchaeota archaeon]|nr:MAG: amidohydrolase [Candidatus Thorarchaeota archaeon]
MKAITNATIVCPVNGLIEGGTILFSNKIEAIGKNVQIPEKTKVIDADGKFVLPGFIDPHTHQGLFDGSIGWAGADGNEMTNPTTPEIRGIDSFNPFEPSLKEVIRGGVTCINTGPGSGNVIAGQAFVVKPTGSGVVDDMVVMAPSGLKIALGENPKRVYGDQKKTPSTRMGVASLLRKTFNEGQNYLDEWKNFGEKAREAREKGEAPPKPPKRNLGMEVIAKVLKREIPLHAHAHRADDIATIIRISQEFNLRLVLIHCTEGHKIAKFIAKAKVPAVVGPTILWVSKPETRERGFETAVILNKAGVKVALQTDSLTPMNYFPILPMNVIKLGMSTEEALKCVTINPAEILGIDDRVGSLEPGKDADIVLWSGHPFEFYSKVEQVFINGRKIGID